MPRAFVIRPFNVKSDSAGNAIDFEQVHNRLIEPALMACALQGATTGEIVEPGNIREDMFSLLIEADVVVCDVTIHNANVFYELGIRHALRKKRTVLLKGSPAADPTPFDVLTDRYVSYKTDAPGDPGSVAHLTNAIMAALASERETDSPIFKMLPGLAEANPATVQVLPLGLREEVDRATAAASKGWLRLLSHEVRGRRFERVALQLIAHALWKLGDYRAARESLELIRATAADDHSANLALANVYERLYRADRQPQLLTLSDQAIERVLATKDDDRKGRVEALALKGRNSKTLWRAEFENLSDESHRRVAAMNQMLRRSYAAYRDAFREDLNHFWSGLAALQMGVTFLELATDAGWTSTFDSDADAIAYRLTVEQEVSSLRVVVASSVDAALRRVGPLDSDRVWAEISKTDLLFITEDNVPRVVRRYLDVIPRDNSFALDAAAGQLKLFASLGIRAASARQVNEALTARVEAATASSTPDIGGKAADKTPHVVVFAGHRFDESGRAVPRFPVTSEKAAYEAIRAVLASMTETDNIVGLASAAPGADILFHEACKELGVASTVCLPTTADQYVGTAGQDLSWRSRIVVLLDEKRKLTPPAVLELADMPGLPRWLEGTNTNEWERGNLWMLEMARTLGPRKVTLLALWDERPIGDGPGGTAHMVSLARGQADVNIEIIRTRALPT